MKRKKMNPEKMKALLDDSRLKVRPFGTPEGYFGTVEERLHRRLAAPQPKASLPGTLKPALLLTCMFLVIGGIGFGTLKLTGTLNERDTLADNLERTLSEIDFTEEEMASFLEQELSVADFESLIAEVFQQ